jgi:hypothetical protein
MTVTEVENTKRRVSLEELLGLAALYSMPLAWFLEPGENDHLRFQGRVLVPDVWRELVLGPDAQIGAAGLDWDAAKQVACTVTHDDRPAVGLRRR